MIYLLCSIRDRVADTFNPPYAVPAIGLAVRTFTDEINRADEKNLLYMHPDDFELYQLGTYDDSTGMVTQDSIPRQIVLGRDCRKDKGNGTP